MARDRKPQGGSDLVKHLEELRRRHAALDKDMAEALRQPEALTPHQLKRRKLRLKDELGGINRSASPLMGGPTTPPPRGRKGG